MFHDESQKLIYFRVWCYILRYLPTPTAVRGQGFGFLPPFVCVSVCLSARYLKTTNEPGSPNLTQKCSATNAGNPFILGTKGQRSRSRVTKTLPVWVFALCECWLLLVCIIFVTSKVGGVIPYFTKTRYSYAQLPPKSTPMVDNWRLHDVLSDGAASICDMVRRTVTADRFYLNLQWSRHWSILPRAPHRQRISLRCVIFQTNRRTRRRRS